MVEDGGVVRVGDVVQAGVSQNRLVGELGLMRVRQVRMGDEEWLELVAEARRRGVSVSVLHRECVSRGLRELTRRRRSSP